MTFNGSYVDGSGSVAAAGIAWDFSYDGNSFYAQSTGTLTPTWDYDEIGDYQAALRITDGNGVTDLSVMQVQVTRPQYVGPTATAGPDQTVNEGGTASFNGSYTDPDGTVSPYSGGVAWDFNYDGTTFNPQSTGTLTPTYQFNTPGTYVVALQVTDGNGLSSLSTLNLTVDPVTPTVSLWNETSSIQAGQPLTFDAYASDPGGAADPVSYAWDFNYDGQNFVADAVGGPYPRYDFTTPGTYTVAVQATDAAGLSALATTTLTVTPSASPVAVAGPDQAVSLGAATFSGGYVENNPAATVDPTTADWDFNYNGYGFNADPSAHGTLDPTHVFTQPGVYTVALELTDGAGATAIGTLTVDVADPGPTASAGPDQTVAEGRRSPSPARRPTPSARRTCTKSPGTSTTTARPSTPTPRPTTP